MVKILIVNNFEPFISTWGVTCTPQACVDGYFIPDGWQDELDEKNISYHEKTVNNTYFNNNEEE